MSHRSLILAAIVVLSSSLSGRAGPVLLTVTVGNLELQPGGTGYVDVYVSGNGDLVQSLGSEFRISARPAVATRLEFVNPQPYGYLSDQAYVFFGDSAAVKTPPTPPIPPVGTVRTVAVPNDTFVGGDTTDSESDVAITNPRLIARLQVTANTMLPPQVGDGFTISLEPSISSFFWNSAMTPLGYSAASGTVTIVPVPEPGTLGLLAFAMAAFLLFCMRRRYTAR